MRAVLLSLLVLWAAAGQAEQTNKIDKLVLPTNLWFQVGEELVYRVYWGFIPVGTATIKTEWAEQDGRKLIAIRYRAISNKVISKIYPVDSTIESLIDPVTFKSVRFTKDLKEGRHQYHEVTEFDYGSLTAHWRSLTKNQTKTFKLEADTRDLVAFLYAVRAWPFRSDGVRQYRVMADDDVYDLYVRVKETESVRLPVFGKVSSVRIEPEAAFNGIFVRKGKITVWVSDDDRRLVTRVVGSLPVVDIDVVLCEVRGPGDDFWTRTMQAAMADDSEPKADAPETGASRDKSPFFRRR